MNNYENDKYKDIIQVYNKKKERWEVLGSVFDTFILTLRLKRIGDKYLKFTDYDYFYNNLVVY